MAKFITAAEAAKLIKDGDSIGVAGMGLSGFPEEVICAIRDSFKETGHPCNLELHQGRGRTRPGQQVVRRPRRQRLRAARPGGQQPA